MERQTLVEKASPSDGLQALVDFIAEAFDRTELTKFVRSLPEGSTLVLEMLDPPASRQQVADGLVYLLNRRGILDSHFFAALVRERPHRVDDIQLIELRYLPGAKPKRLLDVGSQLCRGRYRLEQHIHTGGFGALWRARDTVDNRAVAIKILLRDLPENEYAWRRAMFIRGASRIATIVHPHVAKVLLPHVSEDGHDFCVLEYVEGRSLHAEIRSGRLTSIADILRVLLDVGTGLAEVHTTGALHGDVSPKNIVTYLRDGVLHASLVDFDLVSAMDDDLVTVVGTGMPGTDPYAAPEWKAHDGKLDGRVDVFGLGMTAVFALTRASPPTSLNDPRLPDDGAYIERHLGKFSLDLRGVVRKACALKAEGRHATMAEFCDELKRAGAPFSRAANAIITPEPPVAKHRAPVSTVAAPEQAPPPATRSLRPLAVDLPPASLSEPVAQAPTFAPEPPVVTPVAAITAPVVEQDPPLVTTQAPRGAVSKADPPAHGEAGAAPSSTSPATRVRGLRTNWRLVAFISAGLTIPLIFAMENWTSQWRPDAPSEQQVAVTLGAPLTPTLLRPEPVTQKPAAVVTPIVASQGQSYAPGEQQAAPVPEWPPTSALVTPEPVTPEPAAMVTPVAAQAEVAMRPVSGGAKVEAPRPAQKPPSAASAQKPPSAAPAQKPPSEATPTPPTPGSASTPSSSKPPLTCDGLRAKVLGKVTQKCKDKLDIHDRNGEPPTENLTCPYQYDVNVGLTIGRCKGNGANLDIVRDCVVGIEKWKITESDVSQLSSCPSPVAFRVADGVPQ